MRFGELHRVSLHAYALWLGAEENEESASKVIKSLFGICILSRFASRHKSQTIFGCNFVGTNFAFL